MTLLLLLNASSATGGTYVISFPNLTPGARYDDTPWTDVRIEEAATLDGEYTELITAALDPVDTDPAAPQPRAITVVGATLSAGWYRATFLDDDEELEPHPPVRLGLSFKPSLADVGALLHARTNVMGTEIGTFTDDTAVTGRQVQTLIDLATSNVVANIGTDETVPPPFWATALQLTALLVATLVEASFFPSQIDSDRSAYRQYTAMYTTGIAALAESIRAYGQGSIPGVADDTPSPTYSFPAADPWPIIHALSTETCGWWDPVTESWRA